MIQTWGEVITSSFQDAWTILVGFLPKILGALIVLIIGWIIAVAVAKLVKRVIKALWLEKGLEKLGLKESFEKVRLKFDIAALLGWFVKWFLILVFLIAAADILKLSQITDFLNSVVLYLPNVVIAVVILVIGMLVANFVKEAVKKSVQVAKLGSADFVAGLAKWAIVVFSFMAALVQLKVAASLIQTLFTGFVAMIAIAGGLAFGLGGRDWATRLLEKLKKDISGEGE